MIREFVLCALGVFGSSIGFAVLFNAPRKTILPISVIALIGYMVYLALYRLVGMSIIGSYFLGTVVISVLCELEARIMRMPATVFLFCALISLVPGYDFYSAMLSLVEDNGLQAASAMMRAVQKVAAIAVGAAVSPVFMRAVTTRKRDKE